jgi:chemotaxis protein MotA
MDLMTVIGLLLGFGAVYFVMYRGEILGLVYNIDAVVLVFGGTFATVLIAYPFATIKEIPTAVKFIFFPKKKEHPIKMIELLVSLAEKAKRSGVDSLGPDLANVNNKFLVNSIKMLVDGFEPDIVNDYMGKEIMYIQQRHQKVASVFRLMSTVAPIFGLLGALIGVIQVLKNITDPKTMGQSMAIAMTTSFYGIFGANFLFLPVAVKLSEYSEAEILNMELAIEGILSIQKGDVPVLTEKKLEAFLSCRLREKES